MPVSALLGEGLGKRPVPVLQLFSEIEHASHGLKYTRHMYGCQDSEFPNTCLNGELGIDFATPADCAAFFHTRGNP
jgi:hypothetical protein